MSLLPLLGVLVVVLGFVARINPLLVVMAAAIVSGLASGLDFVGVISAFGKAFNDNRYVSVTWLVLPVIGALERGGLQERARDMIVRIRAASVFSILCLYLLIRQTAAAVGLNSLGGHATMVRPLIAPMAEAAGEARLGNLPEQVREDIRAQAAAAENVLNIQSPFPSFLAFIRSEASADSSRLQRGIPTARSPLLRQSEPAPKVRLLQGGGANDREKESRTSTSATYITGRTSWRRSGGVERSVGGRFSAGCDADSRQTDEFLWRALAA